MDDKEFKFTHKELNCLLKLRKKPRTWDYLKRSAKTDDKGLSIMMSRMSNLLYTVNGGKFPEDEIKLNQIGETIAQAEFDRRFDMYFTRVMSLSALLVSIAAVIVSLCK